LEIGTYLLSGGTLSLLYWSLWRGGALSFSQMSLSSSMWCAPLLGIITQFSIYTSYLSISKLVRVGEKKLVVVTLLYYHFDLE
jgi:hypothetical protein